MAIVLYCGHLASMLIILPFWGDLEDKLKKCSPQNGADFERIFNIFNIQNKYLLFLVRVNTCLIQFAVNGACNK